MHLPEIRYNASRFAAHPARPAAPAQAERFAANRPRGVSSNDAAEVCHLITQGLLNLGFAGAYTPEKVESTDEKSRFGIVLTKMQKGNPSLSTLRSTIRLAQQAPVVTKVTGPIRAYSLSAFNTPARNVEAARKLLQPGLVNQFPGVSVGTGWQEHRQAMVVNCPDNATRDQVERLINAFKQIPFNIGLARKV